MRRVVASVLCVAGLVALTSPASAGDGELTKQAFIEAADALCKKTDDFLFFITLEISAQSEDPDAPPTAAQLEEFADYLVSSYDDLITDLRDLEHPKTDRPAIKQFLKTLSKEVAAIEDDPLLLRDGEIMPKSAKLAKRYGFESCGSAS